MSRVAHIVEGRVVNMAEVDVENIPPHLASWLVVPDECCLGWVLQGDEVVPAPEPTPEEIEAERDAEADSLAEGVVTNDIKLRAVMLTVIDLIEAATGQSIPLTQVRDRVKHHIKRQL